MDGVLEAGFEILQGTIRRDLEALGATNVQNYGFLD
jgi:arginine repressor